MGAAIAVGCIRPAIACGGILAIANICVRSYTLEDTPGGPWERSRYEIGRSKSQTSGCDGIILQVGRSRMRSPFAAMFAACRRK